MEARMDWRELAKGWKHLIAKVDSRHKDARESDSRVDLSIRGALSAQGYDEAQTRPYVPDSSSMRSESSLHLNS